MFKKLKERRLKVFKKKIGDRHLTKKRIKKKIKYKWWILKV